MSALAQATTTSKPSRKAKAAKTVDKALRGGILAGAAAAIAWLLAVAVGTTAIFVLVIASVLAIVYMLVAGDKARLGIFALLAVGWGLVILERAVVNHHGGLWVGAACWLGVVAGARRAGISKRWMALLLYPAIPIAACIAAHENLLNPWGVSWLWIAAILGPVIGMRTLLNLSPRGEAKSAPPKRDPLAGL
jgi:hypothetical protein